MLPDRAGNDGIGRSYLLDEPPHHYAILVPRDLLEAGFGQLELYRGAATVEYKNLHPAVFPHYRGVMRKKDSHIFFHHRTRERKPRPRISRYTRKQADG